jgi:hypothetical protein
MRTHAPTIHIFVEDIFNRLREWRDRSADRLTIAT